MPGFDCFFSVLHKNASVTWPIHAFRVTTRKTGRWRSSLGVFGLFWEKKSCYVLLWELHPSPKNAVLFIFVLTKLTRRGKKGSALLNATARSHSDVTLNGGRSHPLPIPTPFAPLWDFNFGPNAAGGGGADHLPHSQGTSSRTEGLVVHPDPQHQSTNTQWVLKLHECLTNWQQQSCDPKLT